MIFKELKCLRVDGFSAELLDARTKDDALKILVLVLVSTPTRSPVGPTSLTNPDLVLRSCPGILPPPSPPAPVGAAISSLVVGTLAVRR